ncbi:MAG: exodeoxyribonuclease V subunit gamma [Thauera sp.]|nr:exodeoxyribonuclease V subunit gamma [Thauera sp.]
MPEPCSPTFPAPPLPPGFIALHGNRIETLLDTVAGWLAQHPLAPLESEVILVQSNGMAEWVKMALARRAGVCAAAAVQLPARFQWQTYRQVLGRAQVPARSPLDKTALAWRLMRLLPEVLAEPGFAPVAGYLAEDDPGRRFQLALRIADLYDQYQVHRPDWLDTWGEGREVLVDAGRFETPLPEDQRWQARLWQRVLDELEPQQRALTRPQLHDRVLAALEATAEDAAPRPAAALPRRVVLFGMTHVPLPTLQLLAALSRHAQVLLAIPNPCRFHWADILDGREWLRIARRRHPLREGRALHDVGLDAMHLHAHPLLAAWGRQARDFVRQLDAFDDAEQTRARFPLARIDLFDDEADHNDDCAPSLLVQVQRHIRDLLPLAEHPQPEIPAADRSIVFHLAHSPVRELEILHDQLLALLALPPGGKPLRPRDIVVMVPSIDEVAPAIRAVFGQYGRHDPRHIPFDIADLSARASSPLMTAVEWLLRIPHDRCRLSDLTALLDVPAIAARFGIAADGLPRLAQWMSGAGIRWGLDADHRAGLGLDACGVQNTALFGLHRMLMGYAVGAAAHADDRADANGHIGDAPCAGIEPYDEVGGLDAELAGGLARLVDRLIRWQADSRRPATPAAWAKRLRALLADLVRATDDGDRQTLAALDAALTLWLDACFEAGFEDDLPVNVAAEAWLSALERPALDKRFRAGGVTFCTLMPMRAIPFEVVCLLGMNDGDYPRRSPRSDFDLMALPGQQRPGDRARRDDDRQLMLEALLSARRVLYVSWCGRNVRDNAEQPPSVLVAQLRDYLAAGWSPAVVAERTTEHPLQPFSRRYFEPGSALLTYAREWRAAHAATADGLRVQDTTPADTAPGDAARLPADGTGAPAAPALAPFIPDPALPLTIAQLASFLRNPVKVFFRQRLSVIFDDAAETLPDDESFGLDALEEHGLVDELANALLADMAALAVTELPRFGLDAAIARHLRRIERAGRLPIGGLGLRTRDALGAALQPMMSAWRTARAAHPVALQRLPLRFEHGGAVMEDWLDHRFAADADAASPLWLGLNPGRLLEGARQDIVRPYKLLQTWVGCLLAAASDAPSAGLLVGRDGSLRIAATDPGAARATLATLIDGWQQGLSAPLPVAAKTALAFVGERGPGKTQETYEGNERIRGEVEDASLARCYPDFEALCADGRFEHLAQTLYAALAEWVATHVDATPHGETDALHAPEEAAQ